jgi:hypothetical protein
MKGLVAHYHAPKICKVFKNNLGASEGKITLHSMTSTDDFVQLGSEWSAKFV